MELARDPVINYLIPTSLRPVLCSWRRIFYPASQSSRRLFIPAMILLTARKVLVGLGG